MNSRLVDNTLFYILLFAGAWNIALASSAIFFTEGFSQAVAISPEIGERFLSKGKWIMVALSGVAFALSGTYRQLRIFILIAVPGKAIVFLALTNLFLQGQVGVLGLFIGIGDLLFIIPFLLYLRATVKHEE